jgi:hypothetical protein
MPNWCKNRVLVIGDETQRAEVSAFVYGSDEQKFDFSKIVPPPNTAAYSGTASSSDYTCGCKSEYVGESPQGSWQINGKEVVGGRCPEHDAICMMDSPDNWYNWNVEHWGTKWNAGDEYVSDDNGVWGFDTAWSPAEPVIRALAERFPDITFIHDYVEQGIAFVGRKVYNAPESDDARDRFATIVCGGDSHSDEWYGFSYDEEVIPPQMLLTECEIDAEQHGTLVWWATAKALFPEGGWGG